MEQTLFIDQAGDDLTGECSTRRGLILRWLRATLLVAATLAASPSVRADYFWNTFAGQDSGIGTADGQGTQARFYNPAFLALDASGNVYVTDSGASTLRRMAPAGQIGNVVTIAGWPNFPGERDANWLQAQFNDPYGVAVGPDGNAYVADFAGQTIRKVTPTGLTTTYAGKAGSPGPTDGSLLAARFSGPGGLVFDKAGYLYVADSGNNTIRKISPGGNVTTFAGTSSPGNYADGSGNMARFNQPMGLSIDSQQNIYVADTGNNAIRKITPGGLVSTIAGKAGITNFQSIDGPAGQATFYLPRGIAVDNQGHIYVSETQNSTIRVVALDGSVSSLPASIWNQELPGYPRKFNNPFGLAVDSTGALLVADSSNHCVRRISNGIAVEYAGFPGVSGGLQDGFGTAAQFNVPTGITTDTAGNVYVADMENDVIRKITPQGVVSILTGIPDPSLRNGPFGAPLEIDGGPYTAQFVLPYALAADSGGNVFVLDNFSGSIRKVTPTGNVTTLVTDRFIQPQAIAIDTANNLYVCDTGRNQIAKVTPSGVVSVIAGVAYTAGTTDGAGNTALFNAPSGIVVDPTGIIYVADTNNYSIRKITTNGQVSTLAGWVGRLGNTDGTGSSAQFYLPRGLALDQDGNIVVCDFGNDQIRRVTPSGVVITLGGYPGYGGVQGGFYRSAYFSHPNAVAVDRSGLIYVVESDSNIIARGTSGPLFMASVIPITVLGNGQLVQGTPEPLPAGSTIDFGHAAAGSSTQVIISLGNDGATTFSNLGVGLDGGPNFTNFGFSNPSQATMFPGGSSYFYMSYHSTGAATNSANVHITSTGGGINSFTFSVKGE